MTPIYLLYSDEANAQENFNRLVKIAPYAEAIKSVGSIFKSHKYIADLCIADRFYVVDGDCWIVDGFKFDDNIELKEKSVAVFRAKNPINGLVYGHGGIKLFSKDCFGPDRLESSDMTTSLADSYIVINILASEHRFNYSEFSTWRTAARESAKLISGTKIGRAHV